MWVVFNDTKMTYGIGVLFIHHMERADCYTAMLMRTNTYPQINIYHK